MSFRDPRLNRKHEEAMVELGRWVRTRRESLGVTQEELAEAIDTSQRYVSRFELGQIRSLPNAATLGRLASVLDCTMQDLLVVEGCGVVDGHRLGIGARRDTWRRDLVELEGYNWRMMKPRRGCSRPRHGTRR